MAVIVGSARPKVDGIISSEKKAEVKVKEEQVVVPVPEPVVEEKAETKKVSRKKTKR